MQYSEEENTAYGYGNDTSTGKKLLEESAQ